MRAEMTVGLDLCSLENLKIFNGHEEAKKEANSPLESLPDLHQIDADSDEQQLQQTNKKGRQKCGRPANPVPRHKRHSHIKAEYKRRDKIQKCFDSLVSLVPDLRDSASSKESKSSMLFKAAEYGRRLKGECGNMQSEMEALRQELEALGTQIHDLQEQLPQQGLEFVDKDPVKLDCLYDQYVKEEAKKNWKFWIFGFFMRPLYMSYRQAVTGVTSRTELSTSVSDWMCNTLSLTTLRKGFFEALRKISITTGILTSPECLQEEARRSLSVHFAQTPEIDAPPSPKKPKSENPTPIQTPIQTPLPSPTMQRRPSAGVRLARRESRKSKESRSRSNSPPPQEESKQKRRSSHNRGERWVEQEVNFLGKRSRAPSPRSPDLHSHSSQPFLVQTGQSTSTTQTFTPVTLSAFLPVQIPHSGVNAKELVTTLTSLLQESNQPFVKHISAATATNDKSPVDLKIVPALDNVAVGQGALGNEVRVTVPMQAQASLVSIPQQSFMPIDQPSIITSSSLLPLDHSFTEEPFPAPMPDLQSLLNEDSMTCESGAQLVTSVFTTSQPTVTLPAAQMSLAVDQQAMPLISLESKPSASNFLNTDEDSLMKMLTMDVMDINSVMTFFEDNHSVTINSESLNKLS